MDQNHSQCSLDQISFPPFFFEDEEREGFYVSGMMKRNWAAQMIVLSKVDEVCRRHGMRWFADCGTLLGAVRHGGYVPWDDDLDICMFREDYERFAKIGPKELPDGYEIDSIQTSEEFPNLTLRVVNNGVIDFSSEHLKEYCGFPYIAGIDIFPLDGVKPDPEEEEKRREKGREIVKAMELIGEGKYRTPECNKLLVEIERHNKTLLNRKKNIVNELLLLAERIFSEYPAAKADELALMVYWVPYGNHKYPKELFKDVIVLPFENTRLPVPARYDEVLRIEYGDYMQIYKGGSIHDYPIYKDQEKNVRAKEKVNPFRYTFRPEDLKKSVEPRKSFRKYCVFIADLLQDQHRQIAEARQAGDMGRVQKCFEKCREAQQAMEAAFRDKFGVAEGNRYAVKVLQLLAVYRTKLEAEKENLDGVGSVLDETVQQIRESSERALKKKEIVFLPCRAAWWETMEELWESAVSDENNEVYVIPIPYFDLYPDRSMAQMHDERGIFPDYVPVTDLEGYDFEGRHPDEIVIQFPYDEFNTCISLPNYFYSSNLQKFTDKLIYIPCFNLDPPRQKNDVTTLALSVFVENPAVVYADQVIVGSEEMRKLYIDLMSGLSGRQNKWYWEQKVVCRGQTKERKKKFLYPAEKRLLQEWRKKLGIDGSRKILLYYTTISFILENKEKSIAKLRESFEVIADAKAHIFCLWSLQEEMAELADIEPELWDELQKVKEEFKRKQLGFCDERGEAVTAKVLEGVDAFYGNPGHIAHLCRNLGIPVMLQSV